MDKMVRRPYIMTRLCRLLPFPLTFRLTSLLAPSVPNTSPKRKSGRLHATSYLDGLRGLAALIVCVCHYTEANHPYLTTSYGVFPNPALAFESSWIQLPFIRILYSGRPMVHVFFVISGFALSVKALSAIRVRDFEKCHATLASAAFRRPLRLCGPPFVSMVFILFFVRAGWLYEALPTLREQLDDWIAAVYYHVIWPWSWEAHLYPPYNVNLWTVPVELCHSMLLFLMVLALSRVRAAVRISCAVTSIVYCIHCGKWAASEFITGMVLAEAHLMSIQKGCDEPLSLSFPTLYSRGPQGRNLEAFERKQRSSIIRRVEFILHITILIAALFVAGWPNVDSTRTPGIRHLVPYTPRAFDRNDPQAPQKFWFAIASVGIVWSCGRIAMVRSTILESRFAQYAGRISFAVYIVHGQSTSVFNMFQDAVLGVSTQPERWVGGEGSRLRGLVGTDTAFNRTLCWASGLVVLFPLVLVTAHLFCR
ncbi:hypothetical protein HD806DRAFT_493108 [Xylariaceae sp. AK1471]|nr:hypothetical protein HD806DRAFT_493108 [Xylariaceae sp. AK1471]